MTSATAAAPVRLVLTAIILASIAALSIAGRADGGGRVGSAYLAPAAACPGSSNPAAALAAKERAIGCLVNWARIQDRRNRLLQPTALRHAAALKGRRIVSCGRVSHTPCGTGLTASLRATGYRYSSYGENLFVGAWGEATARDVVATWLQSSTHRANVLSPGFRDVGAALVRAPGLIGDGDAVVWIAIFAAPR